MNRSLRTILLVLAAAAWAAATAGCAAMSVQPWDRDLLAQKSMTFQPVPHEIAVDEHIYFSKEGSLGGMTTDGGGCGCN